mmetsp:Transcript_4476/g.7639  ORF Transcript_4476/g.7639 Transcript_4476/m.7639 type:complete len:291 (+) Transcript_4476:506-1378(+)
MINGKSHLQIVNKCSGFVKSGEVLALVGPSGAGKTTLLNFIANRFALSSGTIFSDDSILRVNGRKFKDFKFSDIGSFVEQDDPLFQGNTCYELLDFASKLKTNLDSVSREKEIRQLVKLLGLQDCVDTPVGGLFTQGMSTGERKRTSIAYELIQNPKVLILDEPTSGLDSCNALKLVTLLKDYAVKKNCVVIFSIHQPSTLLVDKFDRVLCMNERGQQIYFGECFHALKHYFQSNFNLSMPKFTNPLDFLLNLSICNNALMGDRISQSDLNKQCLETTNKYLEEIDQKLA